jgi:hypothetical protein
MVLDETDPFRWALRIAAHNVIARDRREEAEKSRAGG